MTRHLLVIGGQRCGTTYLTGLLDSHPDVAMARPARPEPKVFLADDILARGIDWYRTTYFSHAASKDLLGEKSTSYIEVAEAAIRAKRVLGHAEIVVQLRDPVARAVSNWRFSRRNGFEDRALAAALTENLEGVRAWDPSATSVSPFAYLERGRYIEYLEPWFACFPGSVHVTFFDELSARPWSIRDLYARLGLDPDQGPASPVAVNESAGARPGLDRELEARLRDYFRDSDARLAVRLGRRLPWDSAA